jgi:Protein of unknown function (DUF3567)
MQMIYNSPNYCVVEFKSQDETKLADGFEIMDKTQRREIFLDGMLADQFRIHALQMFQGEPDREQVDAFLSQFEGLMHQPLTLH